MAMKAARHDTSVSRILGELLQERMLREEGHEAAMRQYLAVTPRALKTSGGHPTRTEARERPRPERSRPERPRP